MIGTVHWWPEPVSVGGLYVYSVLREAQQLGLAQSLRVAMFGVEVLGKVQCIHQDLNPYIAQYQ